MKLVINELQLSTTYTFKCIFKSIVFLVINIDAKKSPKKMHFVMETGHICLF